MAVEVLLPKLGLTSQTGVVDAWLVADGGPVAVGDPILRLSTDKVDVEVEAEAAGRLHHAVPAGSELPAGAVIAWVVADGEPAPGGGPAAAGGRAAPGGP